jgi:hypothetical protein
VSLKTIFSEAYTCFEPHSNTKILCRTTSMKDF